LNNHERTPVEASEPDWQAARATCLREALRVLRDRHDAEEAAQEAILRAWRHRDRCRSAAAWPAWLRRIARNEALRVAERRRVRGGREAPGVDEGAHAGPEPGPADRHGIVDLLAPLRDHEREVIWLRYLEDLPVAEVGRRVGAPEPTVRVRLHRARLRLRAAVDAAEADARRDRREPARRA
jgi:RNA polymerase sigma-70 factor (ECF subfamily)